MAVGNATSTSWRGSRSWKEHFSFDIKWRSVHLLHLLTNKMVAQRQVAIYHLRSTLVSFRLSGDSLPIQRKGWWEWVNGRAGNFRREQKWQHSSYITVTASPEWLGWVHANIVVCKHYRPQATQKFTCFSNWHYSCALHFKVLSVCMLG